MNNKLFIGTLLVVSMHNAYCMNEDSNPSQPHTVSKDEEFHSMYFALLNAIEQGGSNTLQNALQVFNNQKMSDPIDQSFTKSMSTFTKELIEEDEKEKEEEKKLMESKLKEWQSKCFNKQYQR